MVDKWVIFGGIKGWPYGLGRLSFHSLPVSLLCTLFSYLGRVAGQDVLKCRLFHGAVVGETPQGQPEAPSARKAALACLFLRNGYVWVG